MAGRTLDNAVAAETPEGILLELRPAGLAARCHAFLLDLLIRLIVLNILAAVTALAGGLGIGLFLILMFGLEWLYPVVFELSRSGATPGKRAMGLKVVMDDGLPVTPAASLTRNLLRVADFLPLFYSFGIVSVLLRRDFKRLGDIAASTLVVHRDDASSRQAIAQRMARKLDESGPEPVAPVLPLSARDQAAVIELAARASTLTAERVDELAALAAPISGDAGRSGPDVTRRVLGVARWLLGYR